MMKPELHRRKFLHLTGAALGAAALSRRALGAATLPPSTGENRGRIYTSIKMGMFAERISLQSKFQAMKDMGYDGIELNSPGGVNKVEALAASRVTGLPIHGVVDSIHWGTRLSDPDPEVRERGLEGLLRAIQDAHLVGGSAVLLVPGRVAHPKNENQQQVWDRSIEQIRKALPLSSRLGIHVLIENVWNGFCYVHGGPSDQSAEKLAEYIDAIDSPWVGSYFDIGNHQKYGKPEKWIRTLGRRIVKVDVKDWGGPKKKFCDLGEGDINWPEVRKALADTGFTGWATAELRGGDRKYIEDVLHRMQRLLGL